MPAFAAYCSVISMIFWLFVKVISLYSSLNRFRRAARLIARECTVILSGSRDSTSCMVCSTSSMPSPGRPTIRSILILSNPRSLASVNAALISSTVCRLPMISSVFWFIVCGLMEILVTGCFRITASLSRVILSGLPASTVYSFMWLISKYFSTSDNNRSSCCGSSVVGVPPPI